MRRPAVWIIVAGVLSAVVFAAVTTAGGVGMWIEPQWDPVPRETRWADGDTGPALVQEPPPEVEEHTPAEFPGWLEALLQVAMIGAAAIVVVVLAVVAWRHRPRFRGRRPARGDADFDVLPDVAAAVVDEAEAQRAELLTGSPRNAIVRCWSRLERDVAAIGLPRDPAHTSVEFTERVLGEFAVDSTSIEELGALYREARFSQHPVAEDDRLAALAALDRLHDDLRAVAGRRVAEGVDA